MKDVREILKKRPLHGILGPQNPLSGIYFNGRMRVENWAPSAG